MGVGPEFETILLAAQSGGDRAFAVLYRDLNPRIRRYFASRVPAQADDLTAETWLSAARQLHRFHGDETALRAWLFTIAHGRLVQYWRDYARRPEVVPDSEGTQSDLEMADSAEAEALSAFSAQAAARRIASLLSPDQAEVVLLRVLGDLDVGQVARILGKRPGAVRVLQHKALRRLAAHNFSPELVTR